VLQQLVSHVSSCQLHRAEGGWSAVMRVPHTMPEDQRVIQLLEEERVLVHPGYFFDFPREGYLIMSLLPRPDAFRSAVERVMGALSHA
jgi:aspartate/methionine/tyrosine aminotransferase